MTSEFAIYESEKFVNQFNSEIVNISNLDLINNTSNIAKACINTQLYKQIIHNDDLKLNQYYAIQRPKQKVRQNLHPARSQAGSQRRPDGDPLLFRR